MKTLAQTARCPLFLFHSLTTEDVMTTVTHGTATTHTFTRSIPVFWMSLVVLMLLWSVPAQAQGVQYADASNIIAETTQINQAKEAVLPMHYGMPALKKRMPSITYPVLAERFQIEGEVLVEYLVNEEGRVIHSKIRKSVGYGCDEEVLEALRGARFHPALNAAGHPQQARYLAAFQFKLED